MKTLSLALLAAIIAMPAAAQTPAPATAPAPAGFSPSFKISGLVQFWYHQNGNSNLRYNSTSVMPNKYYALPSYATESGFVLRRAEVKLAGEILKNVTWEIMIDPSINTSSTNPTILQDMALKYTFGNGFEIKAGQYKTLQTWEGMSSSADLVMTERSMIGRVLGDTRDRGITFMMPFGDPKEVGFKLSGGVFNGMSNAIAGKGNDVNPRKDFVLRGELNVGANHTAGLYFLTGSTDQTDRGALAAKTFAGGVNAPTAMQVLSERDKTTNMGGFYVYKNARWLGAIELASGKLGRRFGSVGTAGAAAREHLNQKYLAYALTGGATFGAHALSARYDVFNYNSGDDWYTLYNPYTHSAVGVSRNADYSPEFREFSLGYTFALDMKKFKSSNIKLQYVNRSKNFLMPRSTQTGEQGGDSLLVAWQIAY